MIIEGVEKLVESMVPEEFQAVPLQRTIDDWITFEKTARVIDFWAEDSNLYPIFFTPNVRCFLIEARCRHTANGTSATVTVEKLSNGIARGSGGSMLEAAFTLSANANATLKQGPTTVLAGLQLGPGDSVALRAGGTLTSLRNVEVTVLFGILMKDIPIGQSATVILAGLI